MTGSVFGNVICYDLGNSNMYRIFTIKARALIRPVLLIIPENSIIKNHALIKIAPCNCALIRPYSLIISAGQKKFTNKARGP